MSGISNGSWLPTWFIITRTGHISDSPRTHQQVGQQKFALSLKARFNPCRDSAGCTIVMQWQRKLKSDSSEDQTFFVTRPRHGSRFQGASVAGVEESAGNQTNRRARNPSNVGRNDLANHNRRNSRFVCFPSFCGNQKSPISAIDGQSQPAQSRASFSVGDVIHRR